MHLPATITGSFQGAAAVFQSSQGKGLLALLIVSIIVIYIILGILYESFIHPLTILSGLPSAGFGALLTLMLFRLRPEHLRFRRPHHARRHREEKRHHDD
jgi:HAE1 family hydrophobic/amphiphilic exporter-1